MGFSAVSCRTAWLGGESGVVVQTVAGAVGLDGGVGTCWSRYQGQRRGGDAEEGVWKRMGGVSSQDKKIYTGYILIKS